MDTNSSRPDWINKLILDSQHLWIRITQSALFIDLNAGILPIERVRFALVNFYPVIESFPLYLGYMLSKIPHDDVKRASHARDWLLENLHTEQNHARWFADFAIGFGVSPGCFRKPIDPPAEIDVINNYLWRVCAQGSFAECLGAVNFAMEGPTGEWAKLTREGFKKYAKRKGTKSGSKTMAWIHAHAIYDDHHVEDALNLMALFAQTPTEQQQVTAAAIRALSYYAMALEACYDLSKSAQSRAI